jgi:hypothetical protein
MKELLCLLFVFFSFTVVVFCEVPNEIRYIGDLKIYGKHFTGGAVFSFSVYPLEKDGTACWESGNRNVNVKNGVAEYLLTVPLDNRIDWRRKDLWLQIAVNGIELSPREKITSQFYSFHSNSAENLFSNNEIKITIGEKSIYIGIEGNSLYYKSSQSADKEQLGVPPGTVIAFAGTRDPNGYLLCNGRELDVMKYPCLFRAIGTIYGGNGTSKFRLPDFRGIFLRGTGGDAAPLGQCQGDAIRNITGRFAKTKPARDFIGAFYDADDISHKDSNSGTSSDTRSVYFDASRVVPTANENRPVNYAVNYYIKY